MSSLILHGYKISAVNCGEPDAADENGDVSYSSTTFESIATYTCDAGYILTGSATVTCQADRQWSDTAPDCVRKWSFFP